MVRRTKKTGVNAGPSIACGEKGSQAALEHKSHSWQKNLQHTEWPEWSRDLTP